MLDLTNFGKGIFNFLRMARIVVFDLFGDGSFFNHGNKLVEFFQSAHINQLAPKLGTEDIKITIELQRVTL
jgi:hypothetical protein